MSKPTKRVKGKITVNYQLTESKREFVEQVMANMILALNLQKYPNEVINPTKGDHLMANFSEPIEVKAK